MKRLMTIMMLTLCVVAFTQGDMQAKTKKSRKTKSEKFWGCLAGNVGNCEIFEFVIEYHSTKAYYDINGVRRTIKISRNGNHLVAKAYLHGEYIGYFDGTITCERWKNELRLWSYTGTFIRVDGSRLSFDLYNSAA